MRPVVASGVTAIEPKLRDHADCDNAVGIVEFWGKQGGVFFFFARRMIAAGQEDTTEIVGTEGKIGVHVSPRMGLVDLHEEGGVWRELAADVF